MAKRKRSTAKRAPARRSSGVKRSKGGRRRSASRSGGNFQDAAMEVLKGVGGAVLVAKFGHMVPVADPKARAGINAALGVLLAVKGPKDFRSVGIGAAIASGTMLANEMVPNLLQPSGGIGRVSTATQQRMQAAAERIRAGIAGDRGRTIIGAGGDLQPVGGDRGRTIVGAGPMLGGGGLY